MGAFKDIAGAIGAKVQNYRVNQALTDKLVRNIGPEGVIGSRNMDYYSRRIGKLVGANKQEEAAAYSKDEGAKVDKQVRMSRMGKK